MRIDRRVKRAWTTDCAASSVPAARRRRRTNAAMHLLLAAAVFHLAAPPPAVLGQPELKVVGTWGGAVNTVFVDEAEPDIAYIGSGRRLVILNVADPAAIVELGAIDLGNLVLDIKVRNGYAYIGTIAAPNYVCVVDVSDRANPGLVWHSGARTGAPREVEIFGDWMYVRWGTDLSVYDISTPKNPRGSRGGLTSKVHTVAIVGDKMYVGWDDRPSEFHIYELSSDPLFPTLLGAVTLPAPPFWAPAWDVTVTGNYAYVTQQRQGGDAPGGLAIIDVSDPKSPLVVGTYSDVFNARGIAIAAGHAFMADWTDTAAPSEWEWAKGLVIVDVATDPANPTLVGAFKTHGTVANVEILGDRAYVMDDGEGMIILDISDPPRPLRLGGWHSPTELRKIAKVGDLLYLSDQWNGVTILSVADARRPALVGVYQSIELGLGIDHWGIAGRGDFVYLAAGWNGFEVIDVSIPSDPQLAGAVRVPPNARTIALTLSQNGDLAHIGLLYDGSFFRNYDVSRPEAPSALGTVGIPGIPKAMCVRDDGVAFVAGENRIIAVDTLPPEQPSVLGFAEIWARDVAVDNDLLYAAHHRSLQHGGGLYIQDVSDPANQVTLGRFPAFGQMTAVAVRDRVAYVLGPLTNGAGQGILLVDVSDPAAPALLAETPVPGAQFDVLVDGRYAYVTAGAQGKGLTIVRLTGLPAPGDLNCDGSVDLTDVGPFITALLDPQEYENQYPDCDINNGDTNDDGSVDLTDVESFIELLLEP